MTTDRLDTIKRLAQTDDYWRAYLDGMFDRRNIMSEPRWETYSNALHADPEQAAPYELLDRTLGAAIDQVADRSDYRGVEEVRARIARKR